MASFKIKTDLPVVVYNANKQEVVGIFSTPTLCCRYLFEVLGNNKKTAIHTSLRRKVELRGTIFEFKVVLRYANKIQIDQIGTLDWLVFLDYPQPKIQRMKGFTDTAATLKEMSDVQIQRRSAENQSKKKVVSKIKFNQ